MGRNDKRPRKPDNNDDGSNLNSSNLESEADEARVKSEINIINDTAQNNTASETNASGITITSNADGGTGTQSEDGANDTDKTNITASAQSDDLNEVLHDELVEVDESLRALNSIRTQLCNIPLDLCQREYFNAEVNPLLLTLANLSVTSANLATAVNTLTTSPIVPRKKGKLKSTINLMYDINGKCKDVYKELERRIDIMIGED